MSLSKLRNLSGIVAALCLIVMPLQAQAAKPVKAKPAQAAQPTKERLVLMPLRLGEEDQKLQGAMETALVEGLQQKYEVFSGEQVAKKAREIFMKESRDTSHKECDETRCLQGIAEAFQAELLAIANVTKQDGGYFLALSIRNLFDNKDIYSKSLPCEGCNSFKAIEKIKELVGTLAPVAVAPLEESPQTNDAESDLWVEVAKGNAVDDYLAYLKQYPKGKYIALAKTRLAKIQSEVRAETEMQEKQTWEDAQQSNSIETYESYLSDYPKGRFASLAHSRVAKLKKAQFDEVEKQKREAISAEAKQKSKVPKGYIFQGGLTWMPTNHSTMTWPVANAYCTNTVINGHSGWRLPTVDELKGLHDSGAMNGKGWAMGSVWSSTSPSTFITGYHKQFILTLGIVGPNDDTFGGNYVTCVR